MYCSSCGKYNESSESFCNQCGLTIPHVTIVSNCVQQTSADQPPQAGYDHLTHQAVKKRCTTVKVTIVLTTIVITVGVLCICFFTGGGSTNSRMLSGTYTDGSNIDITFSGSSFTIRLHIIEDGNITLYVDERLSEPEARALQRVITATPNVTSVRFITREEAMESFLRRYSDMDRYHDVDPTWFSHRYAIYVDDVALMHETESNLREIYGVEHVLTNLNLLEISGDFSFSDDIIVFSNHFSNYEPDDGYVDILGYYDGNDDTIELFVKIGGVDFLPLDGSMGIVLNKQ